MAVPFGIGELIEDVEDNELFDVFVVLIEALTNWATGVPKIAGDGGILLFWLDGKSVGDSSPSLR